MADMIDEELKTRYCFSKNSIEFIADLISEDIERDTKKNKAGVEFVFILRSNWLYARLLWIPLIKPQANWPMVKFSYPSFEQLHFSLVLTSPGVADLARFSTASNNRVLESFCACELCARCRRDREV